MIEDVGTETFVCNVCHILLCWNGEVFLKIIFRRVMWSFSDFSETFGRESLEFQRMYKIIILSIISSCVH